MRDFESNDMALAKKIGQVLVNEQGIDVLVAAQKTIDALPVFLNEMFRYSLGDVCDLADELRDNEARHSMSPAYMKTDANILIDAINQIRVDGDWGSTYVVDFGDIDIVTHYHEDGTSSVKAFDSLESLYSHVKLEYECTLKAISE